MMRRVDCSSVNKRKRKDNYEISFGDKDVTDFHPCRIDVVVDFGCQNVCRKMEMPPVHMCAYLNHENGRLKEKIVDLKRQRSELERIVARRSCDHLHTCSISCQTDIDVRPRRNSSSADEITRLQRLLQSQNELLRKYETSSDRPHLSSSSSKIVENLQRELRQMKTEKDQAEQRAEQAEERLSKLEERYERMRREMSVLDENFFEEIEDLKYALQQANQLNREYERTVQMLSDRLGIPYPLVRAKT